MFLFLRILGFKGFLFGRICNPTAWPPLEKGRLGGDSDTSNSFHPPLPPPFQEGAQFASVRADFWDLRDFLFSVSKDFGDLRDFCSCGFAIRPHRV